MTTFISILIWIGLIVLIVLCLKSLITRIIDIRQKKKSKEDIKEDKEENN